MAAVVWKQQRRRAADRAMTTTDDRGVVLYHVVRTHEGFEDSARALFRLLRQGQDAKPGQRWML